MRSIPPGWQRWVTGDPQVAQPVAAHDVGVRGVAAALQEGRLASKLQADGGATPVADAAIFVSSSAAAITAPAHKIPSAAPAAYASSSPSATAVLGKQHFDGDGANALQLPAHDA